MLWQSLWPEPILLLVVVLLSQLLVLPSAYHPLTLFRFYARQLGRKVHPDPNRPENQQRLSGGLAVIVALLPPAIVSVALYMISELPLALDAVLLYCSLDWPWQRRQMLEIGRSLQQQQLTLAREQATAILVRDTSRLNLMGLSKAMVESCILRGGKQDLAVWFWFLLGGGIAALLYRLLLELSQQWNTKLPVNRQFGAAASWLIDTMAAIPMLIVSMILALQYGIKTSLKQLRNQSLFFNRSAFYLLTCASVAVGCSLGGPAYYGAVKIQRSRFIQHRQPGWQDIARAIRIVHFVQLYFILVVVGVVAAQVALQL
uniref:Adenosylcobinamide-phosphate synthase n=1 Tax=Rheinheimera sp. BAL341 TaxID=1708203 RepID=A0A486XS46_9GAMM